MKWGYKAFGISLIANLVIAALVPAFGYFIAWLLIPGAYPAFWLCNSLDPGCKDWHADAAWIVGWFLNVIFFGTVTWIVGLLCRKRKM